MVSEVLSAHLDKMSGLTYEGFFLILIIDSKKSTQIQYIENLNSKIKVSDSSYKCIEQSNARGFKGLGQFPEWNQILGGISYQTLTLCV